MSYHPIAITSGGTTIKVGQKLNLEGGGSSLSVVAGTPVVTTTLDGDLTAIAGLTGTSGILRKDGANTWSLDTNAYLTGNQTVTISGDATGSGSTAITLTLSNSGVTAGAYTKVTVDAKGRVTAGSNPTTLAGYGITDGVTSVSGKTGVVTLAKGDVGLGNVDNTSDSSKPISTATQAALNLKAPLDSPALTGVPTGPTATAGTNSTQLATTEFVRNNKSPVLNVEGGLGWRDLTSELVSRGGSSAPALAIFRNGIYAYQFSAVSSDMLYATFHIQHDYAPGTPIFLHIHWSDNALIPWGVVRWGFEYTFARGHGEGSFPATSTVYVEQAPLGRYQHMIGETTIGILADELAVDGILLVRVFRDAAHPNDTCPDSVFAFTCDVHYQTDRVATLNRSPNFYG